VDALDESEALLVILSARLAAELCFTGVCDVGVRSHGVNASTSSRSRLHGVDASDSAAGALAGASFGTGEGEFLPLLLLTPLPIS